MQVGELFVKLGLDDDTFSRGLSGAKKQMEDAVSGSKVLLAGITALGAGIVALGIKSISAAASAQAMNAQFEQVFGSMQTDAQTTVDNLGKNFDMLPNRIKPAFTMMTSMFKGLGLDTAEAMVTAEKAVTLAADAAAFYDRSYEDANASLNSFVKGNYEGGEAIGLFANETQMAAFASKDLGLDWKNLDEAGKQLTRLEYAKVMQEAAGATGQAARESQSYENQMGNLRQAWQDFKAVLGEPFIEPVIDGVKILTEKVTGFRDLVDSKGLKGTFEEIFPEESREMIVLIAGAITGALVPAIWSFASGVIAATIPLMPFMAAGMSIAGLAYIIYKNWDGIITYFSGVKKAIVDGVSGAIDGFKNFVNAAIGWGQNLIKGFGQGIENMEGWIKQKIVNFCSSISKSIKAFFGIASPSKLMDEYGQMVAKGFAQGIETATGEPVSKAQAMSQAITDALSTVSEKATLTSQLAATAFENIKLRMGETGNQSDLLNAQFQSLNIQLNSQTDIIALVEKAYQDMSDAKGTASVEAVKLELQLESERKKYLELKAAIDDTNQSLKKQAYFEAALASGNKKKINEAANVRAVDASLGGHYDTGGTWVSAGPGGEYDDLSQDQIDNWTKTNIPGFANGGIINKPVLLSDLSTGVPVGVAGEAGPEAITPLSKNKEIFTETNKETVYMNFHQGSITIPVRELRDINDVIKVFKGLQQAARSMGY